MKARSPLFAVIALLYPSISVCGPDVSFVASSEAQLSSPRDAILSANAVHQFIGLNLFAKFCMILIAMLLVIKSASAQDDIVFPAGQYIVLANVSLPNLQTNLVNTKSRQSLCLHQQRASELFPILKHPSFANCSLIKNGLKLGLLNSEKESENDDALFELICQNNHAATGSANFTINENQFSAQLDIKMGAKNMTLTQHLNAEKIGQCDSQ